LGVPYTEVKFKSKNQNAKRGYHWEVWWEVEVLNAGLKPQTLLRPQTSNLKPQTSNLKPQTSDLRPQTSDLRPQTSIA